MAPVQGAAISSTKGTGGDIIILEEAAYCDPQFFYETVAPLMIVGRSCMLAISTLTSEINFYTRLMRIKDPETNERVFQTFQIELVCKACKAQGRGHDCQHMMHLVPRWQSSQKHDRMKLVMQDRPDLIQSELAGLAFESLQQAFRADDIESFFAAAPDGKSLQEPIFMFIDPAAGGPSSDYCMLCITRDRGVVKVIGIDTLSGCKDPDKQFLLLIDHIRRLREHVEWKDSAILVFVESNLGYESEHHERALRGMPMVRFHFDERRGRVGVTTTLPVKHAAVTLTRSLLMEGRLALDKDLVSLDAAAARAKLKDQMFIYSYQFKGPSSVFGRDQMALSGKVGGMKDDVCICLQMVVYHSSVVVGQQG